MNAPRVSIVIPANNEAESLADLVQEIANALAHESYEIIVVDDGSTDATREVLKPLSQQNQALRHLVHDRSCGKSAAILSGVRVARASLIATLDGDGQNDPRYLPALLDLAAEPNVGLAAGQRIKHAHSPAKRIGSRLANRLRARLLQDATRDTACGLKAFRRDVFLQLPYFDTMHRFLPALVLRDGFAVRHIDVVDRDRRYGRSKYGMMDRAVVGLYDLFGVRWLIKRRKHVPRATEILSEE